jgi:hypothetical protein
LLGDDGGRDLAVVGEDAVLEALQKAWAPRVRQATKDKVGADILAGLVWTTERLLQLFNTYAGVTPPAKKSKPEVAKVKPKALPKKLPDPE